ncbi:hypothetical protein N9089_05060, partial [Crocinitomicaceae bacterium]|nr:hypothetical protein [Crocinitomicaceae bacterium]
VLIEAIVAVGVMAVMFTAAMSLFYSSVRGVSISSDELVAIFLAQDLMEQVVAKSQYNTENYMEWLENIESCSGKCTLESFSDPAQDHIFTSPTGCGDCWLYLDTSTGVYSRSGSAAERTQFKRYYELTKRPLAEPGEEAEIAVTVEWQDGPNLRSTKLYHRLYDQRPDTFN